MTRTPIKETSNNNSPKTPSSPLSTQSSFSSPSTDSDDSFYSQFSLTEEKIISAISQRKSFIENIGRLSNLTLNQKDQLIINFYNLCLKLLDLDDESKTFSQKITKQKETEEENVEPEELEETFLSQLAPIQELSKKILNVTGEGKLTSKFIEIFQDLINLKKNEANKIKEETLKDVQEYLSTELNAFYEIISENEELVSINSNLEIENEDQKRKLKNLTYELEEIIKSENDNFDLKVGLNSALDNITSLKKLNETLIASFDEEKEKLNGKISELTNKLNQKQGEQKEELKRLKEEYEAENEGLEAQKKEEYENKLKIEKEKFDKGIESLKETLKKTEEEKTFYQQNIEAFYNQNEYLELKLKDLSSFYDSKIKLLNSKNTEIQKENTELQFKLEKIKEDFQNLLEEKSKTPVKSKKRNPLEEYLTQPNQNFEEMKDNQSNPDSDLTEKEDSLKELKKLVEDFDKEVEDFDKEIDKISSETTYNESTIEDEEEEERIKKELDDDKVYYNSSSDPYTFPVEQFEKLLEIEHQKIKNLEKELENKILELEEAQQSRGRSSSVQESPFLISDKTIKDLKSNLSKLEEEKNKLEEGKNTAVLAIETLKTENAKLISTSQELKQETNKALKKGKGQILFAESEKILAEENLKKAQDEIKKEKEEIEKLREFYKALHTQQINSHKTKLETQKRDSLGKEILNLYKLRISEQQKKDAEAEKNKAEADKQAALNEVAKLKNQKNNVVYVDRIVEKNNFIENSEIEKVRGELYNKLSENKSLTKELEALKKENKELQNFKPDYNQAAKILFGKKSEKAQKIEIDYYRNHRARIHGSNENIKDLSEASDEEIIKEIIKDQEKALVKSVKKLIIKLRNDDELSTAEIATIKAFDKENGKNPIIESIKNHAPLFNISDNILNENKHLKTASNPTNEENHSLLKPSPSTKTLQSSQLVNSSRTRH